MSCSSDLICKSSARKFKSQIPADILENEDLKSAIAFTLPSNYQFEIEKTLWRIREENASHIGLQFPEGLLFFATQISAILTQFTTHAIECTILGDVTYGACCIDDLTSRAIGVDLLVHYGHSCLVPVTQTVVKCLYVFVDIVFDFKPIADVIKSNFPIKEPETNSESGVSPGSGVESLNHVNYSGCPTIALMGTIQYGSVLHATAEALRSHYGPDQILVPQDQPLTGGEVLGCTSPSFDRGSRCPTEGTPDFCVFICDGRFHLESAMVHNPQLPFFRYDPFTKKLFKEGYDHNMLHSNRTAAIHASKSAKSVGIILGTLGRQGSVGIFERLRDLLNSNNIKVTLFLMSEILPDRLHRLAKANDAFIQVACPRLSLDWGHLMGDVPLLTPYEAFVAFDPATSYRSVYPMDYYSKTGGDWTNFQQSHRSGSTEFQFASVASGLERRRAMIRKRAEQRKLEALATT